MNLKFTNLFHYENCAFNVICLENCNFKDLFWKKSCAFKGHCFYLKVDINFDNDGY